MATTVAEFVGVLGLEDKMTPAMKKAVGGIDGKLRPALGRVHKNLKRLAIAGAAAFAAIGIAAIKTAGQVTKAAKRMAAVLGLPAVEARKFQKVIKEVYGDGFGESLEDVQRGVAAVVKKLRKLGITSEEEIGKATGAALTLAAAMEVDVNEVTESAAALMDAFGMSAEAAFDFMAAGIREGLNDSDDFLDTINEYGIQFVDAGANAEQFFSLLVTGLKQGMLGTDAAADLFKEYTIEILSGSKKSVEALDELGIASAELIEAVSTGQLTVAEVFELVQSKLGAVTNKMAQNRIGVALMGVKYEDLTATVVKSITLMKTKHDELQGASERLNEAWKGAHGLWDLLKRKGTEALLALGEHLSPIIEKHMPDLNAALDTLIEQADEWGEAMAGPLDTMLGLLGEDGLLGVMNDLTATQKSAIVQTGVWGTAALLAAVGIGALKTLISPLVWIFGALGGKALLARIGIGAAGKAAWTAIAPLTALGPAGVVGAGGATALGLAWLALPIAATVGGIAAIAWSYLQAAEATDMETASIERQKGFLEQGIAILRQHGVSVDLLASSNLSLSAKQELVNKKIQALSDSIHAGTKSMDASKEAMGLSETASGKLGTQLGKDAKVVGGFAGKMGVTAEATGRVAGSLDDSATATGNYAQALDKAEGSQRDGIATFWDTAWTLQTLGEQFWFVARAANAAATAQWNAANAAAAVAASGGGGFAGGGVVPFAKGGIVPSIKAMVPSVPVQKLARGGLGRPTFALVGEEGPELRTDLGGSHITTARATEQIFNAVAGRLLAMMPSSRSRSDGGGGGGGGQPTVIYNFDFRDVHVDSEQRVQELTDTIGERLGEKIFGSGSGWSLA